MSLQKEELANEALRKSEKDLQHAALYDSLTDLPNRKHFGDILRRLIDEYKDDPSQTFRSCFSIFASSRTSTTASATLIGDKVLRSRRSVLCGC